MTSINTNDHCTNLPAPFLPGMQITIAKHRAIWMILLLFLIILGTASILLPSLAAAAEVTLAWDPVEPEPDGYRLYMRTEGGAYDYDTALWYGQETSHIVTNVSDDMTSYFVVRAYVDDDESVDSNEVTFTPSQTANTAPTADAGDNQSVSSQAIVTLDGSGSTDADSDTLTYQWVQTSGTSVTLSSNTAAQPSFTAPLVTGSAQQLVFQLTVNDGNGGSDTDTCTIEIQPIGPVDTDGDGYNDDVDAFPLNASEWLDTDGDGTGNNADTDDDGDGYSDGQDAFPLNASEWLDTDSDGIGNNTDTDDDGDGYSDNQDAFPLNATEWLDTDSDGIGNNTDTDDDGDGYSDNQDAFPLNATEWLDTDSDGIGNNTDTDDDEDGYSDNQDAFPLNATEWLDTDSDGIGNNTDTDDDGDGYSDNQDAFPLNATEWLDTDSDGIGNNTDTDDDGDGYSDNQDAFPLNATEWLDTDSDGIGNNTDTDDDEDGYSDNQDAFPLNATEWLDTDSDGIGNNTDTDDDGDGYSDNQDAFPLNATEWLDTDSDGIGNNTDTDDDGDGYSDNQDAFPLNASEWLDTDGDGTGNNTDADDDGDGHADAEDAYPLDPSRWTDSGDVTDQDNDGVVDDLDAFPENPDEWQDTDGDGIGNNADTDDDGDGYSDNQDAFPLNSAEWLDTDSDGQGDNSDLDDDGDGVNDSSDAFPLDATESLDSDSDGVGNNADEDDDNDGMSDAWELTYGLDPLTDDAAGDDDGDGVSNLEEYQAGTDPTTQEANQPPTQPVVSLVSDDEANTSLTPKFMTTDFADDDDGDTHGATQWQIVETQNSRVILDVTSENRLLTRVKIRRLILDPDTDYVCMARHYDSHGEPSEWSEPLAFTTMGPAYDLNNNGVTDTEELVIQTDLNADGISDSQQEDIVRSTLNPLTLDVSGVSIEDSNTARFLVYAISIDPHDLSTDIESGDITGYGVLGYKILMSGIGQTTDVVLYFPDGIDPSVQWYGIDNESELVDCSSDLYTEADGKMAIRTITDGGVGDEDGVANGVIVDYLMPEYSDIDAPPDTGSNSPVAPDDPGSSDAGGCFINSLGALF